jgi:Zn-dependent protease with chaperone function
MQAFQALLLCLALLLPGRLAQAADEALLKRVVARVAQAAAPWCGRSTALRSDGVRVCTVRVSVIEDRQPQEEAAQFLGFVVVTRSLLKTLDEDELAFVVGHEFAHLALAHGYLRAQARQPAGTPLPASVLHLLEAVGSAPHEQAPKGQRDQEREADALGLLFVMRAGYSAQAGERFFGGSLGRNATTMHTEEQTHPPMAERARAMGKLAAALCARVAAGQPLLLPEERLLPAPSYRLEEALAAVLPAADCKDTRSETPGS